MNPKLRQWLTRASRCHAHLAYIVRLYARPMTAGGQSLDGESFAQRAADEDRTLLYDACGVVRDEIDSIRTEIKRLMDAAPPTLAQPGSREKVAVMLERATRGESLFIDGDATTPLPPLD